MLGGDADTVLNDSETCHRGVTFLRTADECGQHGQLSSIGTAAGLLSSSSIIIRAFTRYQQSSSTLASVMSVSQTAGSLKVLYNGTLNETCVDAVAFSHVHAIIGSSGSAARAVETAKSSNKPTVSLC